jgi:MFS family permease
MLKKLIYRLIHKHHYWRVVGFDELSELYISMLFRSIGISLIGIFIPIYLYNLGHSIVEIFLFYALWFFTEAIFTPIVAMMIAAIGPKHTMTYSYIVKLIALGLLTTLPAFSWPIWGIAIMIGLSNALFFLAFHVDFSKVKHTNHGGKELGWLYIMEHIGAVAGPLIGGVVAYLFGPQYAFFASAILFAFGAVPLFLTAEPVRLNQKISFEKIKLGELKHTLISVCGLNIDATIGKMVWPMFVAIFVFRDNQYIQLGVITSVAVAVSILSSRIIGVLIDEHKGRPLLKVGAVSAAIIHLFRPFVGGFGSTLAINMTSETASAAHAMTYVKGMYDEADEHEGARIAYLTTLEVFTTTVRGIFFCIAAIGASMVDPKSTFTGLFILGALGALLITSERFKALRVK